MSIKSAIRNWLGVPDAPIKEAKQLSSFENDIFFAFPDEFIGNSYYDLATGAYAKNELVYACIAAITRQFNEAPLTVYNRKSGEKMPKHPLSLLFENPAPMMKASRFTFWEDALMHYLIAGNMYVMKIRGGVSGTGKIKELMLLRPDLVEIKTTGLQVTHYVYNTSVNIAVDDMIHVRTSNPLSPFIGMPPMQAAVRQIASDNEATDFTHATMKNRGNAPGVMVKLPGDLPDKDQLQRMRAQWRQSYSGDNRGGVMFMSNGGEAMTLALNMRDLTMPDLRDLTEARICGIFGVPPIVVGAVVGLKRSTFANYAEARQSFVQDTIIPLQKKLCAELDIELAAEFGNDIYIASDLSDVSSLTGIRQTEFTNSDLGVQHGWLTVNEARVRSGYGRVQGGDVFLRGMVMESAVTPERQSKRIETKSAAPENKKRIDLIDGALIRQSTADKYYEELRKVAALEFIKQSLDVTKLVRSQLKIDADRTIGLQSDMLDLEGLWTRRIVEDVAPTIGTVLGASYKLAADELNLAFDIENETVQAFIRDYGYRFAEKISATSVSEVRALINKSVTEPWTYEQLVEELGSTFTNWSTYRASMVARTELIRAANTGAEAAWQSGDISEKEWLAAGDACEYCIELNGKRVQVGATFLKVGDSASAGDGSESKPMAITYEDIEAPPLHPNCRCALIPVI